MRQAITSILKAICNGSVALPDGKKGTISAPTEPMVPLSIDELQHVVGGDDSTLPKGGWK